MKPRIFAPFVSLSRSPTFYRTGRLFSRTKSDRLLGDDEGRIALISAKDIRTGPRHVKWLQSIEVRKISLQKKPISARSLNA